jgi:glycosyltransferase involved in cell wall biosynthesis
MVLRVCQLTTALWDGGIEERMARVVAGLDRAEFQPAWLALGARANPALIARAGGDFPWEIFPRRRQGVDASLIVRIARALRRLRPDVVHVHNWSTGLYGILAARLAGVPRVIYGVGGRELPEGPGRRQRAVAHGLAPLVTRFTTVCGFLADELAATWGVPRDRVELIPTGIDLEDPGPGKAACRARLGLPADAVVIGTTSADRPVKRLGDLFEAAVAVARARPQVHVLWIGEPDATSLMDRARAAGVQARCHAPGRIEDARALAQAFDVFVNTSDFEGSSNALLEVMAAEVTVVATRVGGTPELVQDGATGLLVPPRDPASLTQALLRLVDAPELGARLASAGARHVRARHSTPRMVAAYAELYRRAARPPDKEHRP